jgi:fatty-acyl-CoA synthase
MVTEKIKMNMLRRIAVGDLLRNHSKRFPDKLSFVWAPKEGEPTEYTYGELNRAVNRLANGLSSLGIEKGDCVGICSLNTRQIPLVFAVAKIGAHITPVNPMLEKESFTYIVKQAEMKLLFIEDTFIDKFSKFLPEVPEVGKFGYIRISGNDVPSDWVDIDELFNNYPNEEEPEVEIDGEDMLTLTYTSGTEAFPKGVVLTHSNWYAAAMAVQADSYKGIHEYDVMLESLPMFYTGGACVGIYPLLIGATVVKTYMPDTPRMVEMMKRYKTTYTVLPPTIYLRLLETPGIEEGAKSFRRLLSFGAPITEGMITGWNKIAPHVQWVSLYALSEPVCFGTVGLFKTIDDIPERDLGWVGIPAPNLEMRLVDDNDNEVPRGEIGEITFRGPTLLKEYYKDEEKTRKAFANGWFHTGDLGRLNERGELIFADRKKDMVKSGGENIPCASVEFVVSSHPKVAEVAAFGVSHPDWMEALTVAVKPMEGDTPTEEEIIQYCRERLPRFKVPKYVIIVDEFPRTATGKILKRELRKIYANLAFQGGK